MGEVLKTGLICDGDFYHFVCEHQKTIQNLDPELLAQMIRRCCEIKAGVVERDPKEQGERALLNLGHTIGHAVEKLMDFQLLHGQCVAIGLVAAAFISMKRGLLTEERVSGNYQNRLRDFIVFRLHVEWSGSANRCLPLPKMTKRWNRAPIKFILMNGIGQKLY